MRSAPLLAGSGKRLPGGLTSLGSSRTGAPARLWTVFSSRRIAGRHASAAPGAAMVIRHLTLAVLAGALAGRGARPALTAKLPPLGHILPPPIA